MDLVLTDIEVRILGSLMEKEMATPEYYPLSLNALIAACNQKSNRNPVVSYDEATVLRGLQELQERKIVRKSDLARVPKFEQILSNGLNLLHREAAVICVLLVRGPQTAGEIRNRSERLFKFNALQDVQETLSGLQEAGLVSQLPRQPGRKESRFAHLFSGEPYSPSPEPETNMATTVVRREGGSMAALQQQVDTLEKELEELKRDFADFKSQFD